MQKMILETRMVCPKSWKCLFLFSERNIDFKQQHITLNDEITKEIKTSKINDKNEFSYIFSHFSEIVQENNMEELGYIFNEIDCSFIPEIILPIRFERIIKPLVFRAPSNTEVLTYLREKLKKNLINYSKKLESYEWFNKENFGYCDITASSALAVLDYLGEIPWQLDKLKALYMWYIKIKSRASFKSILNESCPGLKPFINFDKIDF